MGRTVVVRGIAIGEGIPKICVPLVSRTPEDLEMDLKALESAEYDLVEWRADFYEDMEKEASLRDALEMIRQALPDKPVLFTIRTGREGGERDIPAGQYACLCKAVVDTGLADLLDVELLIGADIVKDLISYAHQKDVCVICSNHEFGFTPTEGEMVKRFREMQNIGADIAKVAVMPRSERDVLTLMSAALTMKERYPSTPVAAMSMTGTGTISRIGGEVFGSAITFGCAGKPSAPGQLDSRELRRFLTALHADI